MRIYTLLWGAFFSIHCFAIESSFNAWTPDPSPAESIRRAKPAPYNAIFPEPDYLGPTIGVPDLDLIYPLNKSLWAAFPTLKANDIRIYGWVNPSLNASTSKYSNIPMSYAIVPNHLELDQLVLRIERLPNTVQKSYMDWGFRVSNLYGIDYRYTNSTGYFSDQYTDHNNLYGYDPVEVFAQWYDPWIAEGMVLTIGRYISPPDIEAQLAPQNLLVTHSLMFTFDAYTQTGVNAAIKLNDTWSIQFGLNSGNDVATWSNAASTPTLLAMLRWVSDDNNNSLWGGVNSFNGGKYKANHTNLQQFNLTWSHRFTENLFTETEGYYIYQLDALAGGTCNFGPVRSFGGGGGCGPLLPGFSSSIGIVNYLSYHFQEKNFATFRTDYLNDGRGQLSGFDTAYMSWTLGLTHIFTDLIELRPEIRYETAFNATPYNNGTQKNQALFIVDTIIRF